MANFTVTWVMNVNADSHEDAIVKADDLREEHSADFYFAEDDSPEGTSKVLSASSIRNERYDDDS